MLIKIILLLLIVVLIVLYLRTKMKLNDTIFDYISLMIKYTREKLRNKNK